MEDRQIRLVDFIQIMLELKWSTDEIKEVLKKYYSKSDINVTDARELFLLFTMKRKLKLMSHMINNDDFNLEFKEANFIDVIENDVFDMGVLLYREYFLEIKEDQDRIARLLVNGFSKANGQLEAKAFLMKRFISHMTYDVGQKFVEIIEQRVFDKSRGNIFIHTLNVVKAACLLIELLAAVKEKFAFLRVSEIRSHIIKVATEYMAEVTSEDEMRFLLLEKDLDNKDALNMIYDNDLVELLGNPFAQNIVLQIWASPYNNTSSIAAVSTNHNLLFNYNHCRYDWEYQLRFHQKKDLNTIGCHGYQFQVWRFAGQSRYFVSALFTWAFVLIVHVQMIHHMTFALYIKDNAESIEYAIDVAENPKRFTGVLSEEQIAWQESLASQYDVELMQFEKSAMRFVPLFYLQWMYVFQLFYQATYAGRTKRVMKFASLENLLDVSILFATMSYLIILLRDYRYGTFLSKPEPIPEARTYFRQYIGSPVNENLVLWLVGAMLWFKAFLQLRFIKQTGYLYEVVRLLFGELFTFLFFYVSILFIYGIIGVILFQDVPEFSQLQTAVYTLFRASVGDYNFQLLEQAVDHFLGLIYFNSFVMINVILLMNLIIAQLAYAYKKVNKDRHVHWLLQTLSVREVSEADDKYSAVISAPFPISVLNLVIGSIVLAAKNPGLNELILHLYFLPVLIGSFITFIIY